MFEHLRAHDQIKDMIDGLANLRRRFGNNQSRLSKMQRFHNTKQKHDESDEAYEERLSIRACHAYPNMEWEHVETEMANEIHCWTV